MASVVDSGSIDNVSDIAIDQRIDEVTIPPGGEQQARTVSCGDGVTKEMALRWFHTGHVFMALFAMVRFIFLCLLVLIY